jgi:hypothetical protein
MIRSNDLKFWEFLPKVGQLVGVGAVCDIVAFQHLAKALR